MEKLVLLLIVVSLYLVSVSCGSYENCRGNVMKIDKFEKKSKLS